MAVQRGNWSFTDPGDDVPDGAIINGGNFTQLAPQTEILVSKTLTINGGNWINVKQQPGWTINGGNWAQVNYCSHKQPHLVAHGLTECGEDCDHVVTTDEIYIDGELVDTIYTYQDEWL